jgi:hypothetical protein
MEGVRRLRRLLLAAVDTLGEPTVRPYHRHGRLSYAGRCGQLSGAAAAGR